MAPAGVGGDREGFWVVIARWDSVCQNPPWVAVQRMGGGGIAETGGTYVWFEGRLGVTA